MARSTLIQGGPAFFTPEGYVPPVQPEQAFMPTDVMRDPIADMFAAQPPLTRGPSLPKPPIPPKEDQIFIDDMPPMREEPPMDFPQPAIDPAQPAREPDDFKVGTLGGAGYGRFPLGTAGPEFIYDDDGNPIMEPKPGLGNFNFLDSYKNQMPKRDDFMSIERIAEPRDEFIPSMPNENPIPFVPPLPIQDPADYTAYTATPSIGSIRDIPISEGDPLNLILNPVLKQPQPIGVPSLMDPRQPMPNLATGIIDPVSQPIQQLPQGPQPIPQVPLPVMPPMREVPPEDFGFGPGIRRSEDFFREEDLVMPPMAPPKPLGEDVPPMPIENMIMANDPAIMPMPSKMPMLPEPMPMPMSMRPRMPMPGPIATPMPMAPTNLQLPQIETQMPMMSLDRGIGSFKTLV